MSVLPTSYLFNIEKFSMFSIGKSHLSLSTFHGMCAL